jgi:magnesium chelatase family protein
VPFLDRIDIHIEVPRVDVDKLTADRLAESSEAIRARVEAARASQRHRFENTSLAANADMGPTEVRRVCQLSEEGRALVKAAMAQLGMSARAFHRIGSLGSRGVPPICRGGTTSLLRHTFTQGPGNEI